jgi:putative DNA primase/helicase
LVESYLKSRKLELPDELAIGEIRFHHSCPFGLERLPAMVCLVRSIRTNEPQAIQRTALSPDGVAMKHNCKTFRLSLGPIAGGAIKIDPDEDVGLGICIGEGVETCLAGRQMGLAPVWSVVSTGGISSFPLFQGIQGLHLFAENDANGASRKAIGECARRWHAAGRDVYITTPEIGKDLNDELRGLDG